MDFETTTEINEQKTDFKTKTKKEKQKTIGQLATQITKLEKEIATLKAKRKKAEAKLVELQEQLKQALP